MREIDVPALYGSAVFGEKEMRERLSKEVYHRLRGCIESGQELDMELANAVAAAMKEWAVEHGATHYTHWFQPLTGTTAEKHDAFISPQEDGSVIMELRGKELTRGEPDASSFPSGGIRAVFEARGYTMWDVTSPAFLYDNGGTRTLCIPTAFCSYTGEALDEKTPLLRAMEAVSRQAVRALRLFGDEKTQRVIACVGAEQEYFIVDEATWKRRKDLIFTGRTLFGAKPPKGQEMEDHYFGSIKERVAAFMREVDEELWALGIPAKTEHNEAAPAQHELAPVHATANVASDQNMLVMNVMKKVARRHGLVCLLHEKPFAGVNGSGKHDNWSLQTDGGRNLLDPGKAPQDNLEFLFFLTAVLKAVDDYAGLLRLSASTAGNDHRLGGDEAPPAIISVFLGDQLTAVVRQLIEDSDECVPSSQVMNVGVSTLPHIRRDATDRNRTSPFAFTGNKFEFRMVPSSACIADANTVLCTITADALGAFADELEGSADMEQAMRRLIRRELTAHQRIIFNGNGYTEAWVAEAARRDALYRRTGPDGQRADRRGGGTCSAEGDAGAGQHSAAPGQPRSFGAQGETAPGLFPHGRSPRESLPGRGDPRDDRPARAGGPSGDDVPGRPVARARVRRDALQRMIFRRRSFRRPAALPFEKARKVAQKPFTCYNRFSAGAGKTVRACGEQPNQTTNRGKRNEYIQQAFRSDSRGAEAPRQDRRQDRFL